MAKVDPFERSAADWRMARSALSDRRIIQPFSLAAAAVRSRAPALVQHLGMARAGARFLPKEGTPIGRGHVRFVHKDAARRLVFGKASVVELANGSGVVDLHGHLIPEEEMEDCAYLFNLEFREADDKHDHVANVGRLVESVALTKEKQRAIGIPPGTVDVCWWVGFKIDAPSTWAKVESGEYAMMSIDGEALLEEVK